jgi:biopolymer transport protein ExbD
MIFKDRFSINTKQVSQVQLEQVVTQLAKLGKNQSVLIQSASDASHQRLITVLNMCAKYGLKNLSVLSM